MSYLKIASISRTTVEDMFTLGVSTSRGNDEKIGQFGSGTMLGTLAWLREFGESPVFLVNGEKVYFTIEKTAASDGTPYGRVIMNYNRKKTPLSCALEFGVMDWKKPELGLREWISNAIDAGNYSLTVVNKIEASADEVAVFVPYRGIATLWHAKIGEYFLHFVGKENQTVLPKKVKSPCKIYRKGVFVRELEKQSLCDYNLSSIDINECRTGDSSRMEYEVEWFNTHHCPDQEHAERIRDAVINDEDVIEAEASTLNSLVRKAFANYGTKVCSPNFVVEGAEIIPAKWYNFIRSKAKECDAAASESEASLNGFEIIPPSAEIMDSFNKACNLIETVGLDNGKPRPRLASFRTKDGSTPKCLGYYQPSEQLVSIWYDQRSSLTTMVHELCHHYSGRADHERAFTDYAHEVIARAINELF